MTVRFTGLDDLLPGTALITGASSGIGAAFAVQLAELGFDLVLVARCRKRLEQRRREILRMRSVEIQVLQADLTVLADLRRVESLLTHDRESRISLLVNNAGYGTPGSFSRVDLTKHLGMVDLHVNVSVRLCRAILPRMLKAGSGAIINVASIAAFFPSPGGAIYASTKTFLLVFSEALAAEVVSGGVRVQALCPGFTRTNFHASPEYASFDRIPGFLWGKPEQVVSASLAALRKRSVVCVPRTVNKLIVLVVGNRVIRSFLLRINRRRKT